MTGLQINPTLATATEQDLQEVQEIYSYYFLNDTVTFEEVPPSVEEMIAWWRLVTEKLLPYIVIKNDKKIIGYAYASPYHHRSAYRFTIEESIYVEKDWRGFGVGKQLLGEI